MLRVGLITIFSFLLPCVLLLGCASNKPETRNIENVKKTDSPKCDVRKSKIDYENCLSLQESHNQVILEDSNQIEHTTPSTIDSRINSSE